MSLKVFISSLNVSMNCLLLTVSEVEKLKGMLLQQDCGNQTHRQVDSPSDDLKVARQEAAQAQESLKVMKGSRMGP